jgi:ATP-dependent Clp protease ATP-binding subunit ClpX
VRFRPGTESPLRLLSRRAEATSRCSFCGKSEAEVQKLVAGPNVSICNDCIKVCNQIMASGKKLSSPATTPK